MDSDLRRLMLTAVAMVAMTVACACISLAGWIRSGQGAMFSISCALTLMFLCMSVIMVIRCVKERSRIGKEEISFIAVRGGEYKKEPPVRGKRPSR